MEKSTISCGKDLDLDFLKGLNEEIEIDVDALRAVIFSDRTGKARIPAKLYLNKATTTITNNKKSNIKG